MRHSAIAVAVFALACQSGVAQDRRVTLSVKPVLCITDNREESCDLSILVAWRSNVPGRYCLHNDVSSEPLRCWQSAETGMIVEERSVQQTLNYWLTDGASLAKLAEAALDVMHTQSGDRRRHRQRRHVWDIL